jgi:hypothetical protein
MPSLTVRKNFLEQSTPFTVQRLSLTNSLASPLPRLFCVYRPKGQLRIHITSHSFKLAYYTPFKKRKTCCPASRYVFV